MITGAWVGLDKYRGRLSAVASQAKNPRRLMTEAGIYMHTTEVPYLYQKSGLHKITGNLFRSIIVKIKNTSLEVGSSLVYARIHNKGGVIRAKNAPYLHFQVNGRWVKVKQVVIPKRRYLYWRKEALDAIRAIWRGILKDTLR